jgi:hypothetical protein
VERVSSAALACELAMMPKIAAANGFNDDWDVLMTCLCVWLSVY